MSWCVTGVPRAVLFLNCSKQGHCQLYSHRGLHLRNFWPKLSSTLYNCWSNSSYKEHRDLSKIASRPQPHSNVFTLEIFSQTSTKCSLKSFLLCFNVCKRFWTLNKPVKNVWDLVEIGSVHSNMTVGTTQHTFAFTASWSGADSFFCPVCTLNVEHEINHDMNSMQTCNSVTFYFMKNSFSDVSRKWILPNMISTTLTFPIIHG